MDKCNPLSTPVSKDHHLSKAMCPQDEIEIKEM
jgi:hypothetical protein